MSETADLVEMFSGIQGEGIYVGRRQVFVRFCGCNLACPYCDTPEARRPTPRANIEQTPGGRDFERIGNPLDAGTVAKQIARLDEGLWHDSVSLTGGEPLLWAEFIARLIPLCEGRKFFLETNGTLPRELRKVVDLVHTVAMDIKLPPATDRAADLSSSREFLAIAARRNVFTKIVVSAETGADAIMNAARLVASVNKEIPLVIQPVTPTSPAITPPKPAHLLGLQAKALGILDDVRVVPQVHKLMSQK